MYFRIFGCNDHGNGNWVSRGWYWLVGFLFVWMINTFVISSKLRGTGHPSRGLMLFWWHQSIRWMPLINVRCQNSSSESDDMIPEEDGQNFSNLYKISTSENKFHHQTATLLPVSSFSLLILVSILYLIYDWPGRPVSARLSVVSQTETDLFSIRTFEGFKPEQ